MLISFKQCLITAAYHIWFFFSDKIGTSYLEQNKTEQHERVADSENMTEKEKLLNHNEIKQSKADAQDREEISHLPDKCSTTSTENSDLQSNENTTFAQNVDENDAISKIMDAVKQLSKEKGLRPRITFLDFAGQSLYYAFHQIYLSPKTCYILVLDMTKRLEERVPDTDEQCASQFVSWTYEGITFSETDVGFHFALSCNSQ